MIKTLIPCDYSKPNEAKQEAIVILEASYKMTPNGVDYIVQHYALINVETGSRIAVTTTERHLSVELYNQFSGAVDVAIQSFEVSELTAFQLEQLRVKIGLFIYVTQFDLMPDGVHVAYNLLPEQWEMTL